MISSEQASQILHAEALRDVALLGHTRDYDHAEKVAEANAVLLHLAASIIASEANSPSLQAAADAALAAARG